MLTMEEERAGDGEGGGAELGGGGCSCWAWCCAVISRNCPAALPSTLLEIYNHNLGQRSLLCSITLTQYTLTTLHYTAPIP